MLKKNKERFSPHMEDKRGWSPSPSSREEQTIMSDNNGHRRDLLEGLLFVETGIDKDETVDIYTIRMGRMVLIESGGEVFARAWLGQHAQRLIEWQPRRRHDDLAGIWYRPAQERSLWVKEAPRKECTHA
jgi:hypothetical protein